MLDQRRLELLRRYTETWMKQRCTIEQEMLITDEMGAQAHAWTVVALNVACRMIREGQGSELVGEQESMIERYRLVVPHGTALAANQRVTVEGAVYSVVSIVDRLTDGTDAQALVVRVR